MKRWLITFTDEEAEELNIYKNGDSQHDWIMKIARQVYSKEKEEDKWQKSQELKQD